VLNFRHRLIHTSVILLVLALHLTSVFGRNSDQKLKIITFAYVIPSRIHPITSVIVIDVFLSSSKAHSVVCVSVSVLDTRVDCAKTYEAIVNQFEDPRNHVLDGSAQRHSQSVRGSDAVLCQITLTSCYLRSFRTVDTDLSPMFS